MQMNLCYRLRKKRVLLVMIYRLIEFGRCYGMEMNVGKTKVTRISEQPPTIQIAIDQ